MVDNVQAVRSGVNLLWLKGYPHAIESLFRKTWKTLGGSTGFTVTQNSKKQLFVFTKLKLAGLLSRHSSQSFGYCIYNEHHIYFENKCTENAKQNYKDVNFIVGSYR